MIFIFAQERTSHFLCHCIRINIIYDLFDSHPDCLIRKYIHNTALIRKWCFPKYRKVFHHSVMNDVFHNLIDKINLPAVKTCIYQVLGKSCFRRIHIQSNYFTHKFSQWFCSKLLFIIFFCPDFTPKDFFKRFHIRICQRLIFL